MNFTEQREELTRRQTENTRGEAKIKQLIDVLDMRKDEAIERTFKVVEGCYNRIPEFHPVGSDFADSVRLCAMCAVYLPSWFCPADICMQGSQIML